MQTAEAFEADAIAQRDAAAEYYSKVYGYCVSNGRICQETADGPKPLANFVAVPRAVVAQDDGVNVNKIMVIDGWDALGAPLPRVQIKAAQFSGMNWVAEKWDFAASIMPGNTVKDKIRYAISEVGRMTAKRITEYSHTGWRQIGGKWAYLYQGGAIGVDNVTVDLGSGLNGYRLDGSGAEGWDKLTYLDGAEVTLTIGNVIAEHVAIPLLGTIFLAPLREFLAATGIAPAYALFLLGGTGTRKSTALALALSHFGNFTGKSLPASFNDTANFIRKKAFLLKDAPIVVDDYHPVTSLQERKKMEATAQSLARAFGDGAESRCAPPRWPATGACAATVWTGTAAAWASAPIAPRWCITSFPWKNGQTLPCPLKTCAACAMRAIIKITPKRAADGRPKNRSNIKCA